LTQVYYLLVAEKQIEDLEKLGLNERQIRAMDYVIKRGFIRNKEYTSLNNVSRKTSTMDLTQLVTKGLLLSVGEGNGTVKNKMKKSEKPLKENLGPKCEFYYEEH